MDEQLLKDFLATAQADNYNWDVIMPKFPELADINLQVLKDYAETAIQKNYDYATINPLFPELFSAQDVKKKTIRNHYWKVVYWSLLHPLRFLKALKLSRHLKVHLLQVKI